KLNQYARPINLFTNEASIPRARTLEMPQMRFTKHKVLLLQQLQPFSATPLLQKLPKVLDQRRYSPEYPSWRALARTRNDLHHPVRKFLNDVVLCFICNTPLTSSVSSSSPANPKPEPFGVPAIHLFDDYWAIQLTLRFFKEPNFQSGFGFGFAWALTIKNGEILELLEWCSNGWPDLAIYTPEEAEQFSNPKNRSEQFYIPVTKLPLVFQSINLEESHSQRSSFRKELIHNLTQFYGGLKTLLLMLFWLSYFLLTVQNKETTLLLSKLSGLVASGLGLVMLEINMLLHS
ncbi:hypothetical protein HAX54_050129, partial [Datura stramonium]|nr:hypothetical protein [Datura stramonium]